ncbi:hypothetical protein ACI7BZ_09460 [Xanthobacter sp. AM11]|uniref:hypothetical protein n=1 Tax=Xanthobacter sp. AM11 TaxID=3380643 RepID=UPI0039BED0E1
MPHHRRAGVEDRAVNLSTTPGNARSRLELWRAKRRVCFIPGGCSCPMARRLPEIYEWVGEPDGRGDAS